MVGHWVRKKILAVAFQHLSIHSIMEKLSFLWGGGFTRHFGFVSGFFFSFAPGTCIGLETFLNMLLQEVELCCTLAIDMQIK